MTGSLTIDQELSPAGRAKMHKAFKRHLSRACRTLFEHPMPPSHDPAEIMANGHVARMSNHALDLLKEVFDILRQGANDPALRYLQLADLRCATDLFYSPFILALGCCIAQIPLMIVRRHVTAARLAELGATDGTCTGWISVLTPSEKDACLRDLAFEKIENLPMGDVNLLDDAAETWLKVIRLLFCPHAVIVSIDRGHLLDVGEFLNAATALLPVIEATLHGTTSGPIDRAYGTGGRPPSAIRVALPGTLVLPPMPWEQLRINWCEHFGELDPVIDPKPDDWEWLIDDGHYLIAFRSNFLITGGSGATQHYMRRLVALSRCFRADLDWSVIAEAHGHHEAMLNHTTPARCRILAMPLDVPMLFLSEDEHLRRSDDRMAALFESSRAEVNLAGRPFVTPGELKDDWIRELETAWHWLSDAATPRADRMRRVVEAYEIACSLGRDRDVPSIYREAWQLVGLMTAVESLLPSGVGDSKQSEIDDEARRLMRMAKEPPATVDQCCARLRSGYRLRNEFVHTGNCDWNEGEIAETRRAVGMVIRAAIRNGMSTSTA